MIELRADGSREGEPTMGRIYVMAQEGKLYYHSTEVELETDWPAHIETHRSFRGFVTGFLPMLKLEEEHDRLIIEGFPTEAQVEERARYLYTVLEQKHEALMRAAKAYLEACPTREMRCVASDIYEDARNVLRNRK
jgi:hypothetical protein